MTKLEKIFKRQDDPNRYVQVHDVKEYFKLPKEQREKFGFWYKKPVALPGLFDDEENNISGWGAFSKEIRKEYPVQGWFREWCFDFKNPVYAFCSIKRARLKDKWYEFKCFFNPKHKVIRKAIPRTWTDVSSLIIGVNFAMIRDFYYNEVVDGIVDWQSDENHKKFFDWLTVSVLYIDAERPKLEKQLENSYPETKDKNLTYEELYSEVIRLEALIKEKDTALLKEMVDKREFFWT